MGCWIAIGRAPGWEDAETFRTELKETARWRADAKTTITTVFALADGRFVAECHAPEQAAFETWLKQKHWEVESIVPVRRVARTGEIWSL
jgi:hypothetical protein